MEIIDNFLAKINEQKAQEALNEDRNKTINIEDAMSWNPDTGHPNGPSPSFAVSSLYWNDGLFDMVYRDGHQRSGVATEGDIKQFVRASSKGRAQREL